jgi:two-component system sensor histidine kinase/response regulator
MLSRSEQIKIQYEIAMAIGHSLDLKEMLKRSLLTILKMLNSPIGRVLFFKKDTAFYNFEDVISVPRNISQIQSIREAMEMLPKNFTKNQFNDFLASLPIKYVTQSSEIVHFLNLPDLGVLFFIIKDDYLSQEFIRTLKPLTEKLAVACKACLQNDELIKHRNHLQELVAEQTNDLKKRKESLEIANKDLNELNATKNKFFSIIAHDLRSPFNGIIGLTDVLMSNIEDFTLEEIQSYICQINSDASKSYKLLENLLDWARVQIDGMEFKKEELDLKELVENNVDLLQRLAKEKEISLRSECKSSVIVQADRQMISTVLRNLISNAIKFTPFNGEVFLQCFQQDEFVKISVIDNGVGINEEDKHRLFKINRAFSTRGTNNEFGTGLGLILCKEFIKKHNGEISVDSQPNEGTNISFSLPIK